MKYIIELGEEANMVQAINVTQNGNVYVGAKYVTELKELNADYINEHFGDLQDDAYNKGYAKCQDDYSDALKHAKDTAYQKGFEDGKAVNDKGCEGCKYANVAETHEPCVRCSNSYENQWTAKDDKIEVGDTVNLKDGSRDNDGIVTKSWDNDRHFVMWADGSGGVWDKEYIVKTGRHFDIQSILEAMKHD